MKKVILRPEAYDEMIEAGRYYEDRSENLGVRFLTVVEENTVTIAENPKAFPVVKKGNESIPFYDFL